MKNKSLKKQSNILMICMSSMMILMLVCYFGVKETYSICEYEDGNVYCYDDPPTPPSSTPSSGLHSGGVTVIPSSSKPSGGGNTGGTTGGKPSGNIPHDNEGNCPDGYISNGANCEPIPSGSGPSGGGTTGGGNSGGGSSGGTSDAPGVKETYDDGSYSVTNGNHRFNYDSNGNLLSTVTTDSKGNITSITTHHKDSGLSDLVTTIAPNNSDDGSYQTTQTNPDGSKVVRNYDKDGKLVTTVNYNADGTIVINANSGSGLLEANQVVYYKDLATCKNLSGGDCTKIGTTYVNHEQVTALAYYTKDYCEKITGLGCKSFTGKDGSTYYIAEDCNCDEGCKVQPISNTGSGGSGGSGGGGTGGNPSNPNTPPGTIVYPSSSPKPSDNVTTNPQTGTAIIMFAWIIAIGAIIYSVYYFSKTQKINK